ncbi:MAG: leucine-rich repeat domain-containing protein [Clostridia bacterium]|nr:leucine-rich repeat domain-containing protein [Clostridia bacterium]
MNIKKTLSLILSIFTCVSVFALTSCNKEPEGPVYADYFVYDAQNHWRPLLEGGDEDLPVVDFSSHVNKKGKCDCGYYFKCPYLTYKLNRYGNGLICYGAANPNGYTYSNGDTVPYDSAGKDHVATPEHDWVHVEIPSHEVYEGVTYPVVELSYYAFKNDPIESLKLNSGLTSICTEAFAYTPSLKEVRIPNSVSNFGHSLFKGSQGIERVYLGSNISEIGANTFNACINLKNVYFGDLISKIGVNAFNGCIKLEYVVLPSGCKTMASSSGVSNQFAGCNPSCKIYFNVTSVPTTFASGWNPDNLSYYLLGEWEYDENGIPKVK